MHWGPWCSFFFPKPFYCFLLSLWCYVIFPKPFYCRVGNKHWPQSLAVPCAPLCPSVVLLSSSCPLPLCPFLLLVCCSLAAPNLSRARCPLGALSRLCLFCWPRCLVRSTLSALLKPRCLDVRCFATPRFARVCFRVVLNATVVQCFKFDIMLGFFS